MSWDAVMSRLRGAFPLGGVAPEVRNVLEANRGAERWAIACSGGADSVFLACWIKACFSTQSAVLLYFNHRTRGEAHRGESDRVRALADALGYGFAEGSRVVEGGADEDSLRRDRFAFLVGATPGKILLLGQQVDDVAESLLMRLGRGSGTEGLAAPRPAHQPADGVWRVRPLLGVTADAIREFLRREGVDFCEDVSNQSSAYLRNRIRAAVMPELRAVFGDRDVVAGMLRSHRLIVEDAGGWECWGEWALSKGMDGGDFDEARLSMPCPRALRRRLLHRWWEKVAGAVFPGSPALVETILDAAEEGGERVFAVGTGLWVRIEGGRWKLERQHKKERRNWSVVISGGGGVALPEGGYLAVEWWPAGSLPDAPRVLETDCRKEAWIDAARIGGRLVVVRNWREGDRFRPIGAPGTRKLQDWFTDRKWEQEARHRTPVVTDSGETVLWVPGFAPADEARIREGTERVLRLTYQ